ncbi:Type II restriction/modification system, DNA methylase subunit YeeA [Ruminococcaceae bacterium YAD3003]|nr:Type II restriction/modification system, DNA methylase subunit YeeA [Ruminococcaceae bacterium YAD3003]
MAYRDKKSRKSFVETWKGRGYEKGETQQFWLSLLTNVLGYEHNDTVLFEHHVSTGGYIDVWIRQSDVMIEQKGIEIDLDKAEMRQGELKTPLQQVQDYAASLPLTEQPKYFITCNFKSFRVYDRSKYGDKELVNNAFEFALEDLVEHPEYLGCIVDPGNSRLRKEQEVSEQAGRLIGELYDMLRSQYHDPDSDEAKHSLNVLCVRLVFCLFCEDAGLFGEPDAFANYLTRVDPTNIRIKLQHLFENLDKPRAERDEYDEDIKVFPYVNGGLFKEKVIIPNFTQEIKDFLLNKVALPVNWSNISPTIFGGIFESTLNPETRRKGGMHYTSPENIHKVIDPLFLDDLKAEFDAIRTDEELSVIKRRNRYRKFHEKLCSLVFFDPACGSGNFLTETFICLKRLEYAVLKEYKSKQMSLFDSSVEGEVELRIKLDQFYGIEINDFAVSVAETALWISRLKANKDYMLLLDLDEKDFPLDDRANIICENALRFDWNDLVEPSRVSYIMGNPPFVDRKNRTPEQRTELNEIYVDSKGKTLSGTGDIDYVAAWFWKGAQYIQNTSIMCAFVSTNSVVQGVQTTCVWKPVFERFNIKFDFAYRTFKWNNDTDNEALVYCVIIGFSNKTLTIEKRIFDSNLVEKAKNINAYLLDADDVYLPKRTSSICPSPKIGIGNQLLDFDNYLFTKDEMMHFIKAEPESQKYFFSWVGGNEFINNNSRDDGLYILWLGNCSPQELETMPKCMQVVSAVQQARFKSKRPQTKKLAETPTRFLVENMPQGVFMVIPVVSAGTRDFIPIGFLDDRSLCSQKLMLLPGATVYHFGVIESTVHMAWMRVTSSRYGPSYQYSAEITYNNFPWPNPTDDQKAIIEQTAQGILDARALYPDKSLAELYDPDKMPVELRIAHEANDKAVMDAYGFARDMGEPEIVAELMKMYQELTKE